MGLNTASLAAVPELIDYQGKVTTSDGTPLNGDYPIQFSIYADSTGGVALWTESHTSVSVSEGLFHVFLGSVADLPDTLFDEADRWLGINVDSDGEMSPRIRIGSVPYALKSGDAGPDGDWTVSGDDIYLSVTGNVGVGTDTPNAKLDVAGTAMVEGFTLPTGATDGYVLTSDGGGAGTWQSAVSSGNYDNVYTVAASGGDYTSITSALNACTSPGYANRYLVRVMPGTYSESITCLSYVRLQGAGKYATRINGGVTAADSCTIDGFFIDGGITCPGVSPTITHNLITHSGNGIEITASGEPWIKENEISECGGWGIHCNGWNTNAWIIANDIHENVFGGIRCDDASPTISNNQILENENYGIYLIGAMGAPSEPTIDDNVIGRTTGGPGTGVGIYMTNYAEPRIIANDIWINYTGIEIQAATQPSIMGNNFGYNAAFGIRCFSSGSSKPVVIQANHIHSNPLVGVDIVTCTPVVSHNNIFANHATNPDIQYAGPPYPTISLNVVDTIWGAGTGATGMYNVDRNGAVVNP